MMSDNLQATIQRLLAGNHNSDDLELIATAVQTDQLVLSLGNGAVAVDGNVENSQIISGSGNVIGDNNLIIIDGADAEKIQAILRQRSPISLDILTQQMRSQASEKVLNLFGKIQLLNKRKVDVDQLYVDVYVLEVQDYRTNIPGLLKGQNVREQFDRLGLGTRRKRIRGLEVVESEDYPRLMVLGKPGSGKSTFLRHLAVGCAKGDFLDGYIPYLLELRDVDDTNFSLFQYIHEEFELEAEEHTKQLLRQGKVLILLDGLDEVSGPLQQNIQNELRKFARRYDRNCFVMTCRTQTTDYIPEPFSPIEVADFNSEQVKSFALNWFSGLPETRKQGEALKTHFMETLKTHPQTAELAVTPVLLSLACWIFEDSKCLPEKRSDLYREGLDLLLQQWDEKRGVSREVKSEIYQKLTLEERKQLLSYLAFRKFEHAENFVLFDELEISTYISEHLNTSLEESKNVLQTISQQHGLIIKRAHEIWSFSHLTFQEYLVSQDFCREHNWENLLRWIAVPYWREVFLILAESPESKNLILKMEEQARAYISSSTRLRKLINWIESATDQFQDSYTFPAKRAAAMYFILDLVTILYQDETFSIRDFDRLINLASDLARRLNQNFQQDDMWEVAVTLANLIDPPYVKSILLTSIGDNLIGGAILNGLLENVISKSQSPQTGNWILNTSYSQALNQSLVKLKSLAPNVNSTLESCLKFAEFCRQVLITSFKVNKEWITGLSDSEYQALDNYLSVNILIADCLNISKRQFPLASQEIENHMLKLVD